jgi:hypothetical protein
MEQEVAAWQEQRNQQKVTVELQFTNQVARVKLKRLYANLDLS